MTPLCIMERDTKKGATGEEMRRGKNSERRKVPSGVLFYKALILLDSGLLLGPHIPVGTSLAST